MRVGVGTSATGSWRPCPDGLWVLDDDGIDGLGQRSGSPRCSAGAADEMRRLLGVRRSSTRPRVTAPEPPRAAARGRATPAPTSSACWCAPTAAAFWALVSHTPAPRRARATTAAGCTGSATTAAARGVEELERRERELAEAQSIARIGSWECTPSDGVLRWSDELYRVCEFDPAVVRADRARPLRAAPPRRPGDGRGGVRRAWSRDGEPGRLRRPGLDRPVGQPTRWVRVRGPGHVRRRGRRRPRSAGPCRTSPRARRAEQGLAFLSAMAARGQRGADARGGAARLRHRRAPVHAVAGRRRLGARPGATRTRSCTSTPGGASSAPSRAGRSRGRWPSEVAVRARTPPAGRARRAPCSSPARRWCGDRLGLRRGLRQPGRDRAPRPTSSRSSARCSRCWRRVAAARGGRPSSWRPPATRRWRRRAPSRSSWRR